MSEHAGPGQGPQALRENSAWLQMFYDTGQLAMMNIRTLFAAHGFRLERGLASDAGLHSMDWVNLAGAYAQQYQGSRETERWAAFLEAADKASLYPVRIDPMVDPWDRREHEAVMDQYQEEVHPGHAEAARTVEARGRFIEQATHLLWSSHDQGQAQVPQYMGDVGVDLASTVGMMATPGQVIYIPLGVKFSAPKDTWLLLLGRSSTASKLGLGVIPGVIDNGFRGEMFAGVFTIGAAQVWVEQGTRLAQVILIPAITPILKEVEILPESDRGENGFGSTGA